MPVKTNPIPNVEPGLFWKFVNIESFFSCWEWRRGKSYGYGVLTYTQYACRAHRMAVRIVYGKIPDGLYICHKCDNPPCVNPNHLFLGTAKDNAEDRITKGRHPKKYKRY